MNFDMFPQGFTVELGWKCQQSFKQPKIHINNRSNWAKQNFTGPNANATWKLIRILTDPVCIRSSMEPKFGSHGYTKQSAPRSHSWIRAIWVFINWSHWSSLAHWIQKTIGWHLLYNLFRVWPSMGSECPTSNASHHACLRLRLTVQTIKS